MKPNSWISSNIVSEIDEPVPSNHQDTIHTSTSRHQEQNCDSVKAQNGQYMTSWAWLLLLLLPPPPPPSLLLPRLSFLTRHRKCNINSDCKIIKLQVNQSHYIENMLDKFKHLNIKEANSPFNSSMKLNDNCDKTIAQLKYTSVIGSLMYDMHCTRPNMTYDTCKLSRYTSKLNMDNWKAIIRVFGYLKRMIDFGLFYYYFPAMLERYCDASWITSSSDNKSTPGWIFFTLRRCNILGI